jgi:60kDa lysophospholipase
LDTSGFGAYASMNYPVLAKIGINIQVEWDNIRFLEEVEKGFSVTQMVKSNVLCLKISPGMSVDIMRAILKKPLQGVVLETFGSGNAPNDDPEFLKVLKDAVDNEILIFNVTQCKKGSVQASYATGNSLLEIGIIPGVDMTPEAALTKLMYVLSLDRTFKERKKLLTQSLRGEMTESRVQKFSLFEREFVYHVAKSILEHPNQSDIKEIRGVLFPVLLCSLSAKGALTEIQSLFSEYREEIFFSDYDQRSPVHIAAGYGHLVHFFFFNFPENC